MEADNLEQVKNTLSKASNLINEFEGNRGSTLIAFFCSAPIEPLVLIDAITRRPTR